MKPLVSQLDGEDCLKTLKKWKKERKIIAKKRVMMGEVYPSAPLGQSDLSELMPELLDVINFHGYEINGDALITPDICVVKGNVGIHFDADIGISALVLLEVAPLCESPQVSLTKSAYSSDNYLWAGNTLAEIKEGGVVIFNTEKEHAWFCSGVATFVTVPVKRKTKSKRNNLGLS